jgi:hypothetical protein
LLESFDFSVTFLILDYLSFIRCWTLRFWLSSLSLDLLTTCIPQVRDAKIRVFSSLKQDTDEERSEWKKLSASLKVGYY